MERTRTCSEFSFRFQADNTLLSHLHPDPSSSYEKESRTEETNTTTKGGPQHASPACPGLKAASRVRARPLKARTAWEGGAALQWPQQWGRTATWQGQREGEDKSRAQVLLTRTGATARTSSPASRLQHGARP